MLGKSAEILGFLYVFKGAHCRPLRGFAAPPARYCESKHEIHWILTQTGCNVKTPMTTASKIGVGSGRLQKFGSTPNLIALPSQNFDSTAANPNV